MKKLILAGILILICCSVFLIIRQNSSRADITMDVFCKAYPVLFGDWVYVWLQAHHEVSNQPHYWTSVGTELIGGRVRYRIQGKYCDTKLGRLWYQNTMPQMKESIEQDCKKWTLQGYPISLNDFEFDIEMRD